MSAEVLPYGNNTRTLFKYEPFSYIYYAPDNIVSLTTSPNLVPFVTRIDPSAVVIAAPNGYQGIAPSTESVVIDQGIDFGTTSNVFNFNPGRFFDSNATSFNNRVFTFFNKEAITPILFDSCINLASVQTFPTLPAGLQFVRDSSTGFLLSGTPLVQIPTSNYRVIGTGVNPAQVVATTVFGTPEPNGGINIGVNAERLQVNVTGSTTVSPMVVNIPISTTTLSTTVANPSSSTLQYTWGTLPSGIQFSNNVGIPYLGNVATILGSSDPTFTIQLNGTPTIDTAKSFARAGITDYTIPVNTFRINPLPVLSNSINFTFRFEPMVIFDDFSNLNLFKDVSVNSNIFYSARTYFTTDASITSIVQSGFPSGVDVSFVFSQQRAYLVGNPTVAGTFPATLTATTGSLIGSNDIVVTVQDDTITFQPPTATSDVSFIVSRPLSLFKPGYYTSNVEFKAVAASGCNVTYTVSGITGTGIETTLSNDILRLTGIPSTVTPPSTLTVTASRGTASASTSIQYEIRNDIITFSNVPFSNRQFVQNREIIPIQFVATTLSDRVVVNYSGSNLPNNLRMSPTGLLTGTVIQAIDGSFTAVASTGYVSSSIDLSYTVVPDTMLLISPVSSLSLTPLEQIGPLPIIGLSSSGRAVSNYQFIGLSPTYGLTINSANGILNGTLIDGATPSTTLPISSNFSIKAFTGDISASLNVNLSTFNRPDFRTFMTNQVFSPSKLGVNATIYGSSNFSNWFVLQSTGAVSFVDVSYTNALSNEVTYNNNLVFTDNDPEDPTKLVTRNSLQKYTLGQLFDQSAPVIDFPNANDGPGTVYSALAPYPGPILSAISVDASTGLWWGAGGRVLIRDIGEKGTNDPIRWFAGNIVVSSNRGQTWQSVAAIPTDEKNPYAFFSRDISSATVTYGDYYRNVGIALSYKNGVMLLGGEKTQRISQVSNVDLGDTVAMLRSVDNGSTWIQPTGSLQSEVASFSTDNNSIWIATGSDLYRSGDVFDTLNTLTNTIRYSTDEGLTWSNTTGDFTGIGYHITYANNTWIATGVDVCAGLTVEPTLRFSTDGSNWFRFDVSTTPARISSNIQGPEAYGLPMFDGNNWYIPTYQYDGVASFIPTMYIHDASTSLTSNWTSVNLFPDFPTTTGRRDAMFYGLTPRNFVSITSPPNQPCTLTFSNVLGNGPVFTSPISSNVIFYQYLPITPITFAASGNGEVSYLINGADLPRGLQFDPITLTISGTPVVLGEDTITMYATDSSGSTAFTLRTTTLIPRFIKQQTSAGAYTSLVRQYTQVNAAQNSINNLVYPNQEQKLGQFAAPEAPDTTKYI